MVRESTQQKLSRNRPPRVQITYDVEVGGAIETKELPLRDGRPGRFQRPAEGAAPQGEGAQVHQHRPGQLSTKSSRG